MTDKKEQKTPSKEGKSTPAPTAAAPSRAEQNSAADASTERKGRKAKAKTNRVSDDFEDRFARLEQMVGRISDILEEPQEDMELHVHPEPDLESDMLDLHPSLSEISEDDSTLGSIAAAAPAASPPKEDMGFATKYAIPSAVGKPIANNLAVSVKFLMGPKLKEETMNETGEKYLAPSNCDQLVVPRVHPPIWDNIQSSTRSRDLKIQRVEKPLVKGIIALTQTLPTPNMSNVQQDSLALLCHALHELNLLRKEFMKPDINPKYVHLCKDSNPVTQWLFGDDLSKKVKDMKEEQKAAEGVMKSSHSTRHYRRSSRRDGYQPYDADRYRRAGWRRTSSGTSAHDNHFLGQSSRLNRWRKMYQTRQQQKEKKPKQRQDSNKN